MCFGCEQRVADPNRRDFVLAYPPETDFVRTAVRVESPHTIADYERNREGPVLGSDVQGHGSPRLLHEAVHFLIFLYELLTLE
jgi:hypothetical protein